MGALEAEKALVRVLVVDDEPDLRDLLKLNLELAGHEVVVASDGIRGLQAVRELKPDVVVLDVMMPGIDGWTVLQSIKDDPDRAISEIPVLMLTARAEDIDRIRGGIEGAVRYLTKPFSMSALRSAVIDAINGEPEPEKRRTAQRGALAQLARLESGSGEEPTAARPKLSRLEPSGRPAVRSKKSDELPGWLQKDALTQRDCEIVRAVISAGSLNEARLNLDVSRSYLYASLRRIAIKLEMASGPRLVQALRAEQAGRNL